MFGKDTWVLACRTRETGGSCCWRTGTGDRLPIRRSRAAPMENINAARGSTFLPCLAFLCLIFKVQSMVWHLQVIEIKTYSMFAKTDGTFILGGAKLLILGTQYSSSPKLLIHGRQYQVYDFVLLDVLLLTELLFRSLTTTTEKKSPENTQTIFYFINNRYDGYTRIHAILWIANSTKNRIFYLSQLFLLIYKSLIKFTFIHK